MKTSRFTDSQIIAIRKPAEGGSLVPELCRKHGISNATFYKWRTKFGSMDALLLARMKELQDENCRLKKMDAEERLKAEIVAEALAKSGSAISAAGDGAGAVTERLATVKLACQAFCISQTCYRYKAKLDAENDVIADWLVQLTNNQRNRGYGPCFLYLRNIKGFK